jgi:hypothetical protein
MRHARRFMWSLASAAMLFAVRPAYSHQMYSAIGNGDVLVQLTAECVGGDGIAIAYEPVTLRGAHSFAVWASEESEGTTATGEYGLAGPNSDGLIRDWELSPPGGWWYMDTRDTQITDAVPPVGQSTYAAFTNNDIPFEDFDVVDVHTIPGVI